MPSMNRSHSVVGHFVAFDTPKKNSSLVKSKYHETGRQKSKVASVYTRETI